MDKTRSKKIVVRGERNVLTINGEVDAEDFTSILGKDIDINGLGNVVSGERIRVEGENSFILGTNIDFRGSDSIIISRDRENSGDRRFILDRFCIPDLNLYMDSRLYDSEFNFIQTQKEN
jgi:hypothetical protein